MPSCYTLEERTDIILSLCLKTNKNLRIRPHTCAAPDANAQSKVIKKCYIIAINSQHELCIDKTVQTVRPVLSSVCRNSKNAKYAKVILV